MIHEPILERPSTCDTHGDFISKCYLLAIWTKCPTCSKLKHEQQERDNAIAEIRAKTARLNAKINNAGIPQRFVNKMLSNYVIDTNNEKQRAIFAFCTDYALDFEKVKTTGKSFMLLGSVGTGKTHLSIGIALEIIKRGHSAIFTSASKMFRNVKETYRNQGKSEKEVLSVFTECDLLIIDEVGVQRGTDYEKDIMFDVINERYENLRPTIILSNLSVEETKAHLGERVFDRLRENGGKAFLLNWQSHRSIAEAVNYQAIEFAS